MSSVAPTEEDILEWVQDLLVVDLYGQPVHIPYTEYRNKSTIVGLKKGDQEVPCFINEDGTLPLNLFGPVITKVLPWNISSARPLPPFKKQDLKPGYIVDLRMLNLARLNNPLQPIISLLDGKISYSTDSNSVNARVSDTPSQVTKQPDCVKQQMADVQPNNLYVISWAEPLKPHSNLNADNYQINFLSSDTIEAYSKKQHQVEPQTAQYLTDYFTDAGVQVGTLNPLSVYDEKDLIELVKDASILVNFIFPICYVINLNSFNHD